MPQMAPLMWLLLFFFFIFSFILFINMNYFITFYQNKNTNKLYLTSNKKTWKLY